MNGDRSDFIFTGGVVHTVDPDNNIAQAVAVADGKIIAVGSNATVKATAGPGTHHVELNGRSLTPGFIDAHQHFTGVGDMFYSIDCKSAGMDSISAIVDQVRVYAETQPAGTWIRGRGYDHSKLVENRHPNRHDLDAVSPDHPVLLTRTCGHIVAFNTKAAELAGLSLQTDDPNGGRFDRDPDGKVSGVAYERATGFFRDASAPDREEIRKYLTAANQAVLASGITSVHDAGGLLGPPIDIATDLLNEGVIQVRLYAFATVSSFDHPLVKLLDGTGLRTGFGNDRLRIGAFKVMTDGSSSGPTASTRAPYHVDPDDSGILYWEQDELDELLGRAHRAGWQCTVHALGDRAIEQTLNAMERAQIEDPREGLRHRIDHCGIAPPDLQQRVLEQRIVPVMQPAFFWEFGDGYINNYGRDRADVMFPVKSIIDGGGIVAGSSDSPVTDYRPLFGVEQALTRATMGGNVCGPDERVDLNTAIRMHTINGAYAEFADDRKGSIEVGKYADLTVLSEDIRTVEITELRELPIDMVVVEGDVVFE